MMPPGTTVFSVGLMARPERGAPRAAVRGNGTSAMKLLLRFCGFLFAAGTIVFLVGVGAAAGLLWHFSKDLPDYSQLQDYEPPVMTRVHAGDGSLVAEYANQRRLYIPIQAVPKMVINAFLAAEDKNFYEHNGLDFGGIIRAGMLYVQTYGSGRRPQGASTITQQVAKNFLLTNEVSLQRKIKEALLSLKIERAYSKEKILELYLNEIYLGLGAYGRCRRLAALFRQIGARADRRRGGLSRGAAEGAETTTIRSVSATARSSGAITCSTRWSTIGTIKAADAEKSKKEPLNVTTRPTGAHIFAAEYFAEEVRRWIYEKYGEKTLYEGGLSVRTTLDPKLQVVARKTLIDDLVKFDETQGWRGPVTKLVAAGDWGAEARRGQATQRHRAVAARRGARDRRSVGAGRPLSVARRRRRADQGASDRHRSARRREMGEAHRRPDQGQGADQGQPDSRGRRRGLCRSAQQGGQHLAAAAGAGNLRRDGGDGPGDGPRAGDGRRLLLRPEPVQPRHAGACGSPAPRSSRSSTPPPSTTAIRLRRWWSTGRSRSTGPRPAAVAAGKLFRRQVLRTLDAALSASSSRATP